MNEVLEQYGQTILATVVSIGALGIFVAFVTGPFAAAICSFTNFFL